MDNSKSKENQQVEPLRPCCACPDTRNLRDECIISFGEEKCSKEIENHKLCLKKLGFE
ncbi:unnamed protein product (macronuclear) [Paramecium tetraurelia]|uniref:Cytochrome c oxidase copper chaperone n=1 Tax=Paramecium tetraurelia TaxID=5888 RepID=A0E6J0_PARTE|nr:uncharacterized protein GSPATT00003772001 [Paramecium tetraurelia]CAK90907.1 unnamed protein product [Paramecium tetraurelia]|eukprot:XP_001458304.1 hypothetical protein (macronuclear) [Paramecium tetraurelia strain d4-2]